MSNGMTEYLKSLPPENRRSLYVSMGGLSSHVADTLVANPELEDLVQKIGENEGPGHAEMNKEFIEALNRNPQLAEVLAASIKETPGLKNDILDLAEHNASLLTAKIPDFVAHPGKIADTIGQLKNQLVAPAPAPAAPAEPQSLTGDLFNNLINRLPAQAEPDMPPALQTLIERKNALTAAQQAYDPLKNQSPTGTDLEISARQTQARAPLTQAEDAYETAYNRLEQSGEMKEVLAYLDGKRAPDTPALSTLDFKNQETFDALYLLIPDSAGSGMSAELRDLIRQKNDIEVAKEERAQLQAQAQNTGADITHRDAKAETAINDAAAKYEKTYQDLAAQGKLAGVKGELDQIDKGRRTALIDEVTPKVMEALADPDISKIIDYARNDRGYARAIQGWTGMDIGKILEKTKSPANGASANMLNDLSTEELESLNKGIDSLKNSPLKKVATSAHQLVGGLGSLMNGWDGFISGNRLGGLFSNMFSNNGHLNFSGLLQGLKDLISGPNSIFSMMSNAFSKFNAGELVTAGDALRETVAGQVQQYAQQLGVPAAAAAGLAPNIQAFGADGKPRTSAPATPAPGAAVPPQPLTPQGPRGASGTAATQP